MHRLTCYTKLQVLELQAGFQIPTPDAPQKLKKEIPLAGLTNVRQRVNALHERRFRQDEWRQARLSTAGEILPAGLEEKSTRGQPQ